MWRCGMRFTPQASSDITRRGRASVGSGASRLLMASACLFACVPGASAQAIHGRVVDAATNGPVATAGVFLLTQERKTVSVAVADTLGRYALEVPRAGDYYLVAQRIGYRRQESPLISVSDTSSYSVDIELEGEPVELDPLTVTVTNREMERWFRLRTGANPNTLFGFRAIQGARLEEAKAKSDDNTEMLRWLFIPISHHERVCLFSPIDGCGLLYVDGYRRPNEFIESVDLESVAAVIVTLQPPRVWLFTKTFDWTEKPGG